MSNLQNVDTQKNVERNVNDDPYSLDDITPEVSGNNAGLACNACYQFPRMFD